MYLEGKSSLITFQYERLPRICFHCGVICPGPKGCLKRSEMRNMNDTTQYGPWLRAPSPPRRTVRNIGRFAPKHGRTFEESQASERHSQRGTSRSRRGEERNRGRNYADDEKEGEGVFWERDESPQKKEKGGYSGKDRGGGDGYSHYETQTKKERFSPTNSQRMGFQWVYGGQEESEKERRMNMGKEFNEKDVPKFKTATWKEDNSKNKNKINEDGLEPRVMHGHNASPGVIDVGRKGYEDKRANTGGVYTGLCFAEIEKTVKEAQTNASTGNENGGIATALVTWKRKERDWLEGPEEGKKDTELGDSGKNAKTPKMGRKITMESIVTSGSGLVATDVQPRRPQ